MGEKKVHKATERHERSLFISHLLCDIKALEYMLENDLFEKGIIRIGAEQEFCLVDKYWRPSRKSVEILEDINDEHFTTEIGRFNLEINLDPLELRNNCFSQMHNRLNQYLDTANDHANKLGDKVVLTGILPSISKNELHLDYMTPNPRYWALNESMKQHRGRDFDLSLRGVDELFVQHDSVLFEACNTSFQMHLQIDPKDFVSSYNWAQAISGPVLSICTNSPLLLGRELWHETRIALFQQSIDTRKSSHALTDQEARVSFGNSWASGNASNIYKKEISRFKILLAGQNTEDSLQVLKEKKTPKLRALNLFNGTIYRWNRACYGVGEGKAHLRIENRYIPSGPSTVDEIANFAFWVGIMVGRPQEMDNMPSQMDFRDAKQNFMNAARNGKESIMVWDGVAVKSVDLIRNFFLPLAYEGLKKLNVDLADISKYLKVIENRLKSKTGSGWLIDNYRSLQKSMKKDDALRTITKATHLHQDKGLPIHLWPDVSDNLLDPSKYSLVSHFMSTETFSVHEDDNAQLALEIMLWNNIHHLPVVNTGGELVGLLTWSYLERYKKNQDLNPSQAVKDIMIESPIIVQSQTTLDVAIALMNLHSIGCLPVVDEGILVGILTKKDLEELANDRSTQ